MPTIGFLGSGTAATLGGWTVAFVKRLRELGWIEGRTVAIEYRWAEGRNERSAEFAAEFVRLNFNAIVTVGTPTTVAAIHATSIIPIVFVAAGDPVGTGLVASLARPGGNVTGVSNQQSHVTAKRLERLREVVPGLSRLAIIGNSENSVTAQEMGEVKNAARTLGLAVSTLEIRRAADIPPAFKELKRLVDALYVCTDGLTIGNRVRINTLALVARLPTMHGNSRCTPNRGFTGTSLEARGSSSALRFKVTHQNIEVRTLWRVGSANPRVSDGRLIRRHLETG